MSYPTSFRVRVFCVAGAALAALVLIASWTAPDECDDPPPATAPPTTLESATPPVTVVADRADAARLVVYYRRGRPDSLLLDAEVVDLAWSTCAAFDAGATFDEVIDVGVDSTLDAGDYGYVVGSAAAVVCPRHLDLIPPAPSPA